MTGAVRLPLPLVAALALVLVTGAAAETPNLVAPKPGEVVVAGGVRVRVPPKQTLAPEACCVLQFQRRDGTTWGPAPVFGAETAVPGVADAIGASFRREAFTSAAHWRVRARFTTDTDWTDWREFAVTQEPK